MNGKVGIVLINYNGENYIKDCIDSLLSQTYKNIEVLFWDNNSRDNSVKIVKENYPNIRLVESKCNYGFAKANNLAVKILFKIRVEYILLLNVDTIADPHLIEYLLERANEKTVTTAQIYINTKGRNIWYAGGELKLDIGNSSHLALKTKNATKVTFISGCCMMIHKEIIKRYGLFDTDYYLYYEDTDLCMRWYLNHINMYYIPKAKLWHRVGGSSGGIKNPLKEYYLVRNRLYFVDKYRQYIKQNKWMIIFTVLKEELSCISANDWKIKRAACLGLIDYIKKKKGITINKLTKNIWDVLINEKKYNYIHTLLDKK